MRIPTRLLIALAAAAIVALPAPEAAGAATVGGYQNPLRGVEHLSPSRIDEGVDYGGSGPIYALGDGVVTSTKGPWPHGTYLTYVLSDGPAEGKMVYVAENVTPKVKIGQQVTADTVVGVLHDAYPDMEIGWADDPDGGTMATASHQWTPKDDKQSVPSAFGVNFDQLLVALGAPPGVMVHAHVAGKLPAGWPHW